MFHKDQDGKVRTYMSPGAQLSIAFNPELMIRVTLQPPNCSITVMEEFQMPDVPQPALKSVRDAAVPARAEALWAQLNEWVSRGTLYLANGRWHHRA